MTAPEPSRDPPRRAVRALERVAWGLGITCVAVWVCATAFRTLDARREIRRFEAARTSGQLPADRSDYSLWSPQRIQAWRETLSGQAPQAIGVLRIPGIGLVVPVLEGTDDWTLNRAVGHIADTAAPGAQGNSGVAGHRDGFFRGLKDVKVGDEVVLEMQRSVERYVIERTWIVDPDDVSVLDPTETPALTLVTCYPFYFIGSAPQRFIVRAVVKRPMPS